MKKLIIANWKLNPTTEREAVRLARAEDVKGAVIAPPFSFLPSVRKTLKRAALGAQDAFWFPKGAYTGEVSGHQLKRAKVAYVILGHSERRAQGESDAVVNRKVSAALHEGLKVVLCVGEPWRVRKRGLAAAKRFVAAQLRADLKGIENRKPARPAGGLKTGNLLIAYEPVWAIGTGKADKPAETAAMAHFIKKLLTTHYPIRTIKVLYGGSVTPKNARLFLGERGVDGALVGGASLRPQDFKKIIGAAEGS